VGRNDFHSEEQLVAAVDATHATICRGQRELLSLIGEVDRRESWLGSGARDTAHWVSMRYGISCWKANRWIAAAHALEGLPRLADALVSGEVGLDKVVELTRFASPGTEADLVSWAKRVSCATVRHRADLERRASIQDDLDAERSRFLSWWYFDEGRRLGLEAELPAAQGAIVVRALERAADSIPAMPDERDGSFIPARRADALVALCSARIARDADQDRATVVVHAQLDGIEHGAGGCEIDGGSASTRRPSGACSATLGSRSSSRTGRGSFLGSVAPRANLRRGCCDRSATATASVGSPGAERDDSPRPTTSCGGGTGAARTWATSC
jgi:hypothetical protein